MRLFANEKRTELLKIKVKPSVLKKAIEAWYVCYPNSENGNKCGCSENGIKCGRSENGNKCGRSENGNKCGRSQNVIKYGRLS